MGALGQLLEGCIRSCASSQLRGILSLYCHSNNRDKCCSLSVFVLGVCSHLIPDLSQLVRRVSPETVARSRWDVLDILDT